MSYPPLHITFLGTGTSSGVPMIACNCAVCHSTDPKDKRLRSSLLVQSGQTTLVIDTGPDFRQQMLTYAVKKLDAIAITHAHKDHIAGLDDVRAYNYFQQKPMELYATQASQERIKMEFDYAFSDLKISGVPSVNLHQINEQQPFTVGDLKIVPVPVWHMRMPVLGFRLGDFTYITDANRIDEPSKEKIKGSKILVLNALRHKTHLSHFTLKEAIALADELGIPQVYFTHISHQMGFHQEVEATLAPGRNLAYDGLEISV
ncbi:MBL fold metallo-hydrolase [Niabella ginsenosidivorans]|uniref:MBL fold metallo-hydrolase n=1 Tax=Niabella ginsenosidivorans TaxID=1176587 RepID=A0A1A9HXH8_9BACT|nr:MBL fold metallo-hydrolase [Niabella ginsenosidivorans]ANH79785.1 MBL fold metallo-hydrolase [Niabella ginsenosidivorans]